MQTAIYLPRLELTMENVRVASVQVQLGQYVTSDQPLIEVETEKAVQPVPALHAGFVRKLCVHPEDQLGERALICVLTDTLDEPFDDSAIVASPAPPASEPAARQADRPPLEEPAVRAAPAARKRAKDLGLDLTTITGTGPGGRITVADVEQRASALVSSPSPLHWEPLPPRRRALIDQMQRSLAEIPQFHVARLLEVEALLKPKADSTFTVGLIRCVAQALATHPQLRTVLHGVNFRIAAISVSVAMDSPRGLVAPVLRTANLHDRETIAATLKSLRLRAAAGTLRQDELDDAPFAISNLGMFQVDFFSAFVFHGQTAVLAVGRAVTGKAWFNLAADHRVVDGAEAARFLETLQQHIYLA